MRTLADYDAQLRQEAPAVTLLGQLPYDEGDLYELRAGLGALFRGAAAERLRRAAERCELPLALYLVLEGTYHYNAGDYWRGPAETLGLDDNGRAQVGDHFRRTLAAWGLPTFEHLGGHRYVTPILAHVGIPNYCLDDFFDLLARALRRDATPDAATLIADWRDGDFPAAIDKPVQRFLRAGGPIAEDFVDRCLELWRPDADAASLGLPARVLDRFEAWRAKRDAPMGATGARLDRPALRLDPYGEGLVLDLAPVLFDVDRAPAQLVWDIRAGDRRRVETAVRRRRGDGFVYEPRDVVNVLTAAGAYAVTLLADDRPLQTWRLDGPGDPPPLAFDPDTGELLRRRVEAPDAEIVVSPGERWLAFPHGWRPADEVHPLAVLPEQPGDWAAWVFQTWRLGPGERLAFVSPDGRQRAAIRAHHDAAPPRPVLRGVRVAGDGPHAPWLSAAPPTLLFPRHQRPEEPAGWRYTLEPVGLARPAANRRGALGDVAARFIQTDEGLMLPLDALELLGSAPFGAFRLTLRGPYGRTADFDLRLAPGLELARYPRRYHAETESATFDVVCADGIEVSPVEGEAGVSVGAPQSADTGRLWPITAAPSVTRAGLTFRHSTGAAFIADVPIYRVRWGVRQPDRPDEFAWSSRPLTLCPDALGNRVIAPP
jgi:hypothetical protein